MRLKLLYLSLCWFCLGSLSIRAQVPLSILPSRELGHPPAAFNPVQPFLVPNFNANLVEGRELNTPLGVALDTSVSPPILYVADSGNNRVLGWYYTPTLGIPTSDPSYRFPPADIVIGQSDRFSTTPQNVIANANSLFAPSGLAVDRNGNLYVVDTGNNRVLRFPRGSTLPDLVIGQASFNSRAVNSASASTLSLNGPVSLAFDRANPPNLYLTDIGNSRVLRFAASDLTAGARGPSANLVLGQPDFTTSTRAEQPNDASGNPVMDRLRNPYGLAFDAQGRLYVSDAFNRVLVFPPNTGNNGAQAQFIAGIPPNSTPPPTAETVGKSIFGSVRGIFVLSDGRVGVLDAGYSRVLIFPAVPWPAFTSRTAPSPAASSILGQASYATSTDPNRYYANRANGSTIPAPESGSDTFWGPATAFLSQTNELFVADTFNHRVLVLPQSGGDPPFGPATRVIGQDQFKYNTLNLIEGREFQFSIPLSGNSALADAGMVIDQSSSTPHLYVADTYNNRILCFNDARAVKAGVTADFVLGQPDMFHSECNYPRNDAGQATPSGLCRPIGLALDSKGNLWVADSANARVLQFLSPFSQGTNLQQANLAIGQPDLTSNQKSPLTFGLPYGVALDPSNTQMAISDQFNNRVLLYEFQNGTWNRTKVLGQTNTTSCPATPCPFGPALNQMHNPAGVAMDSSGIVYVADSGNGRVLIFTNVSNILSNGVSASNTLTGLNNPQSVFVNQQTGEIWVANTNSSNVLRYPQLDKVVGATPLSMLEALNTLAVAQDQFGDLYVADASNRVVIHYPSVLAVNGANFLLQPNSPVPVSLAPGMLASICPALHQGSTGACGIDDPHQFGEDIATFQDLANPIPLPRTLADTQVLINGNPAPLLAVTPRQINFQVPMNTPLGTTILDVVRASTGQTLGSSPVSVESTSPGLIYDANRRTNVPGVARCQGATSVCYQAAASNQDGSPNRPDNPAPHGTTITIYGTGQGFLPDAPPDGELTPPAEIKTRTPDVNLGGQFQDSSLVTFSGLAPGLVGVWQINLKISDSYQAVTGGASTNFIIFVRTSDGKSSTNATAIQTTIAIK